MSIGIMTNEMLSFFTHWYFEIGLPIVSIIDRDALFGACLGAWVVTSARRALKGWQHVGSFLLSACVGYLFTPVALPHLSGLSVGVTAFICALVVIPISIKLMIWVNTTDIAEVLRRLRGPK